MIITLILLAIPFFASGFEKYKKSSRGTLNVISWILFIAFAVGTLNRITESGNHPPDVLFMLSVLLLAAIFKWRVIDLGTVNPWTYHRIRNSMRETKM